MRPNKQTNKKIQRPHHKLNFSHKVESMNKLTNFRARITIFRSPEGATSEPTKFSRPFYTVILHSISNKTMGKKTGATQRLKKRVDAISTQLTHEQLEKTELEVLQSKPDTELFVLDTSVRTVEANIKKRKELSNDKPKREDKRHRISELDQRRIRKLKLSSLDPQVVVQPAAPTTTTTRFKGGLVPTNFNLWDDQEYIRCGSSGTVVLKEIPRPTGQAAAAGTAPVMIQTVPAVRLRKDIQQPSSSKATSTSSLPTALQRKPQPPVIKVDIAQPGQSYRPDKEQHQDVIGEALAIELRRQDRIEYNKTPLSQGYDSKSRLALYHSKDSDGEDEDDDDDEESDSDINPNDANPVAKRKREKLTRTQRNKQKRVREENRKVQQRKQEKQFVASLEETKKFSKEIKRKETTQQSKREQLKKLKELEDQKPVGIHVFQDACQRDPIRAPSLPVALTEELERGNQGGALRSLKTKGSLVTDRLESFVSRNILSAKVMERKMVVQGRKKRTKVVKDEFLLA